MTGGGEGSIYLALTERGDGLGGRGDFTNVKKYFWEYCIIIYTIIIIVLLYSNTIIIINFTMGVKFIIISLL